MSFTEYFSEFKAAIFLLPSKTETVFIFFSFFLEKNKKLIPVCNKVKKFVEQFIFLYSEYLEL